VLRLDSEAAELLDRARVRARSHKQLVITPLHLLSALLDEEQREPSLPFVPPALRSESRLDPFGASAGPLTLFHAP
jgi:hypothetical protein